MQTQSTRLVHSIQSFYRTTALAESGRCATPSAGASALGGGRFGRLSPERLFRKREHPLVRVVVNAKHAGSTQTRQHLYVVDLFAAAQVADVAGG